MGMMVVLGGMMGTTYNQAIQGVVLLAAMLLLFIIAVLMYFGGNPFAIISQAMTTVPPTEAVKVMAQVTLPAVAEGATHGPAVLAEAIRATNMAIPLLGIEMGGEVVLGIVAAGAMAAMLSTSLHDQHRGDAVLAHHARSLDDRGVGRQRHGRALEQAAHRGGGEVEVVVAAARLGQVGAFAHGVFLGACILKPRRA